MDERPLRICVVFDEVASARDAEVLIMHVASDFKYEKRTFRFDELNEPKRGVAAARKEFDTDILVLAARGDQALPSHIRLWLGLCLGLRDERHEGALAALIAKVNGCDGLHSTIVDYLGTIAIIGGVAFFSGRSGRPMTLKAAEKRLPGPGRIPQIPARSFSCFEPVAAIARHSQLEEGWFASKDQATSRPGPGDPEPLHLGD